MCVCIYAIVCIFITINVSSFNMMRIKHNNPIRECARAHDYDDFHILIYCIYTCTIMRRWKFFSAAYSSQQQRLCHEYVCGELESAHRQARMHVRTHTLTPRSMYKCVLSNTVHIMFIIMLLLYAN